MKKTSVIVVVGPTASGKTDLSIKIAQKFNCEIISADSMQIYNEFNTITAKPSKNQLNTIKHYMVDCVSIKNDFSVADYVVMAKRCVNEIIIKGKLPLVVGGTGLYINSFLNDTDFLGNGKEFREIREGLYERYNNGQDLYAELGKVDPISIQTIKKNDVKRVIRALEFYHSFGVPISVQVEKSKIKESPYNSIVIGLNFSDRKLLYNRINQRVDDMLKNGLCDEVKEAMNTGIGKTAAASIGYKEMLPFVKGECSMEDAVENIKIGSRRYSKRQITWFKKNKDIKWLYVDKYNSFLDLESDAIEIIEKELYKSEI